MIEPGTYYDLPNDEYHADTDYLSSSYLKTLLPERYKQGGSQDALDFGTLFHTTVLEPDKLDTYAVLDAEKIGLKADGTPAQNPLMTRAWKDAVAEAEAGGKTVIPQDWWDRAHAMADAIHDHPTAAALLAQEKAAPEVSVFVKDDNGVGHKARFDLLAPVAVDLKSTSTMPGGDSLARAVIDYGYDLSVAHYLNVADLAGIDVDAFALVFVGKQDPYRVTVAELDDMFIIRGQVLRSLAIERHVNPAAPRYEGADGFLSLTPPRWAQLEELSA